MRLAKRSSQSNAHLRLFDAGSADIVLAQSHLGHHATTRQG